MDGQEIYNPVYRGSMRYADWQRTDQTDSQSAIPDNIPAVDLNEQFIQNRASTALLRVTSDAMCDAGIAAGDILVVDRSLQALNGKIVVAVLNGEMLIRRFQKTFNRIRLIPDTSRLSPIDVDVTCCEFGIWGVVTCVIRQV